MASNYVVSEHVSLKMIFLIDFSRSGHHEMWSDQAQQWLERAHIPSCQVYVKEEFLGECSRSGKIAGSVEFWSRLNTIVKPAATDLCFFMYWDYVKPFWLPVAQRTALFSAKIGGIWMNTWGFRDNGRFKSVGSPQKKYPFLADRTLSLAVLDESVAKQIAPHCTTSIRWMPDYTETSLLGAGKDEPLLSELRHFKTGKKLLLVIGAINGTKNLALIEKLIEAPAAQGWAIAIVGEYFLGPELLETFRDHEEKVKVWNGRIETDALYNSVIKEADLLWGVYLNWEGSSNLVTKAGQLSIPIVVSRGFLMDERITEYGLGYTVDQHDPTELFHLLSTWDAQRKPSITSHSGAAGIFRDTFSTENASRLLIDLIQHILADSSNRRSTFIGRSIVAIRRLVQQCVNIVKAILNK